MIGKETGMVTAFVVLMGACKYLVSSSNDISVSKRAKTYCQGQFQFLIKKQIEKGHISHYWSSKNQESDIS